jgi:hypothetical protein
MHFVIRWEQMEEYRGSIGNAFGMHRSPKAFVTAGSIEMIALGLGRGMGETIRIETINGEECALYSGYILRKASG